MPKTTDKNKYFVVRERAVPEVLLNVVAAKKLLESKRVATVQELSLIHISEPTRQIH